MLSVPMTSQLFVIPYYAHNTAKNIPFGDSSLPECVCWEFYSKVILHVPIDTIGTLLMHVWIVHRAALMSFNWMVRTISSLILDSMMNR